MVFLSVLLLLGAVWTHQITAKCNKGAVDKIKALNVNNANNVQEFLGDWKLVYLEAGRMTESFTKAECEKISFSKDGQVYKVDYDKLQAGVHEIIIEKDGVFVHKGSEVEPDMTYYTVDKSAEALAFYACFDNQEEGPELSMVLVKSDVTDYVAALEAAKAKLKSVGLPIGRDIQSCAATTFKKPASSGDSKSV